MDASSAIDPMVPRSVVDIHTPYLSVMLHHVQAERKARGDVVVGTKGFYLDPTFTQERMSCRTTRAMPQSWCPP